MPSDRPRSPQPTAASPLDRGLPEQQRHTIPPHPQHPVQPQANARRDSAYHGRGASADVDSGTPETPPGQQRFQSCAEQAAHARITRPLLPWVFRHTDRHARSARRCRSMAAADLSDPARASHQTADRKLPCRRTPRLVLGPGQDRTVGGRGCVPDLGRFLSIVRPRRRSSHPHGRCKADGASFAVTG
jgi:hypothetical protein